jgi:hypothetical protein
MPRKSNLKAGIYFYRKIGGKQGWKDVQKEFPEGFRISDGTLRDAERHLNIHEAFEKEKNVTKAKQQVKHARGTIYSHLKKRF